jgi:uncharacterized protein (TIGR02145 family)
MIVENYLAQTSTRMALVIGNADYQYSSVLRNPVNDATDLAATLRDLGFEVMLYTNLNYPRMKQAIDMFGEAIRGKDVGMFYFSGHGAQTKNQNYLIPVDANPGSEAEIEYECVNAGRVLVKMQTAGCRFNIVILDACRNNPFEKSWSRDSSGRGLAFITAPTGSIIAYSTSPGNTASDGFGRNGLYTAALIQNMVLQGLKIEDVFKRVRLRVQQESGNQQVPWESTSLTGDFYFNERHVSVSVPDPVIPGVGTDMSPQLNSGTITDVDGNIYRTVKIGDQWWMAENLKVTHYRNGDSVPELASVSAWSKLTIGARCSYNNDENTVMTYGYLYNWYAVNDQRNLAPAGWHVPTNKDWKILIDCLEKSSFVGGKLKEAGTSHWQSPNEGATNESGFTALPGGSRNYDYEFGGLGYNATFWSSTEYASKSAWYWKLNYNDSAFKRGCYYKQYGFSIRCIRDN